MYDTSEIHSALYEYGWKNPGLKSLPKNAIRLGDTSNENRMVRRRAIEVAGGTSNRNYDFYACPVDIGMKVDAYMIYEYFNDDLIVLFGGFVTEGRLRRIITKLTDYEIEAICQ